MRHRIADKKFNRNKNQRKNLFRVLLRALVEQGEIVTTMSKAKAIKRLADKLVGQAQDSSQGSRRTIHRSFGKRDAVNTLVDKVAPAMAERTSGFVRITALGSRRGDNTAMAKIEFVKQAEEKSLKNTKADKKPAAAKVEKAEQVKKADEKKPSVKKVKKAEAKK